jgi:hypothetical protein
LTFYFNKDFSMLLVSNLLTFKVDRLEGADHS